jgi:hypothetical protein
MTSIKSKLVDVIMHTRMASDSTEHPNNARIRKFIIAALIALAVVVS